MRARWRRIGSVAILALGLVGWIRFEENDAQATSANLLTNGSFTSDLSGWTLSRQTFGWCVSYEPPHVSTWPFLEFQPHDGNAVWLNACGAPTDRPMITQALVVEGDASYEISGYVHTGAYLSGNQSNPFDKFDVLLDGVSQVLVFGTPDSNGWTRFSTTFVASSSSIVVGFLGEKSHDIDYVIDSLSVVRTTSPTTTTPPAPIVPVHSVTLDMSGGECVVDDTLSQGELTVVFVGYRYVPGREECHRNGFSFLGWALRHSAQPAGLPLLIDPRDDAWRYFVAEDLELVAMWTPRSAPESTSSIPTAPETVIPSDTETRAPIPSPMVLPVTGPTSERDWLWAVVFLALGILLTVMSRLFDFLARDLHPYGEESSPDHRLFERFGRGDAEYRVKSRRPE